MKCFDCGKLDSNLIEYEDGRRTVHLCKMCKAERDWKQSSNVIPLPQEKSFFDKFTDWLRKVLRIQ